MLIKIVKIIKNLYEFSIINKIYYKIKYNIDYRMKKIRKANRKVRPQV
jgi:hypothetical protein